MRNERRKNGLHLLPVLLMLVLMVLAFPSSVLAAGEGAPEFSQAGGFYAAPFSLTLTSEEGGEIRYTTDGSEPSSTSTLYSGAINVTAPALTNSPMTSGANNSPNGGAGARAVMNAMVVKAATFSNGQAVSKTITHTYFVDANIANEFSIPVMAVSMNPSDFVGGSTGMYTNWSNESLTPQCYVEYYTADGTKGFEHSAEVKISGHGSRGDRKKSLRFNFPKGKYEGDSSSMSYDFFPSTRQNFYSREKVTEHAKITARVTDWQQTLIHESFIANAAAPLRPETMMAEAIAIFINGEFWGVYETREQVDNNYIAQHYSGIKKNQVIALAFDWNTANRQYRNNEPLYRVGYDEGPDDEEEIWYEAYMEMYNAITQNDLSNDANFERVKELTDIDNMIDYFLIYMYGDNTDWPGNNYKLWRTIDVDEDVYGHDAKWRYIIHDFDTMAFSSASRDGMTAYTTPENETSYTRPRWAVEIYRSLFESEEFRERLAARYSTYSATAFSPATANKILDQMIEERKYDFGRDFVRWNINGGTTDLTTWNGKINSFRSYLNNRPANIIGHIRNYYNNHFGLNAPTAYTAITFATNPEQGHFDVAGAEIRPDLYDADIVSGWTANYIKGLPIEINAKPVRGNKFKHFEIKRGGITENIAQRTYVLTPAASDNTIEVRAVYEVAAQGNKEELQGLYQSYSLIVQGDYTEESWKELTKALVEARKVIDEENVTEDVIDDVVDRLKEAHSKLSLIDLTALENLVAEYESFEQGYFNDDSWDAFDQALADAISILNQSGRSQRAVDRATRALQNAIANLSEDNPNVALRKTATSSATLASGPASAAVDGVHTMASRWETVHMPANGEAWWMVDLGTAYNVTDIAIYWEATSTRATTFLIEFSEDGNNWTPAFDVQNHNYVGTNNWKGTCEDEITIARYVRINCIQKSGTYGYSFFEFEVHGNTRIPGRFDKTELGDLTTELLALEEASYTSVSWLELQEVLQEVETVLSNDQAMQIEVDRVLKKLQRVYDAMQLKGDKSVLHEILAANENRNEEDYAEGWTVFETIFERVQDVINDPEASQAQVDAILQDFQSVINSLRYIPEIFQEKIPVNFQAVAKDSASVEITWDNVEDMEGVVIEYTTPEDGIFQKVIEVAGNSFVHTNLEAAKTYEYKLCAYRTISGVTYYSDYTTIKSVTLPSRPVEPTPTPTKPTPTPAKPTPTPVNTTLVAPKVKAASAGATAIKVSWGKVKDSSGYIIYRGTKKNGAYKKVKTVNANSTSYTDKSLKNGRTYYYKVRAYKKANGMTTYSSYSNVVKRKAALTKPTQMKVVKGKGLSNKISWKKVAGAKKYEIYRATSKNGKYVKIAVVAAKKLNYTDKKIKKGTTYYYKVRATQNVNKKTYRSNFSAVKYRKVK